MGFLDAIVKRRVMTTVIVLMAVILGVLAYLSIPLRRFPDIDFPMATITTVYPGGSPEAIESEITKLIEDAISSIDGIDELQSYSQQGMSLILVQFDMEEDINVKAMDIRDKIDQVKAQLPSDAEDPIVGKFDISQFPLVTVALLGPQDIDELYRIADEVLEDRIAQVSGVAEVQIAGGRERQIRVLLDPVKLRKNNVSPDEIARAIQGTNLEIPAGTIKESAIEYSIRTTGRFDSVEQILNVAVANTGSGILRVRDLGTVKDTFEDETTRSRADGRNSIIMSIIKQSDANDVEVSDGILEALPEMRKLIPAGAELFVVSDDAEFIRGALANVRQNMMIGILLTAITLYLFFGSWRGTVIVALVMPSALVVTFLLMLFSGLTLNILTLTALALSMGIIVNNAILVLENAQRLVDEGMEPVQAAIAGTKDIGLAIFSSTATNLVVFMPVVFMGEMIGEFFGELGLTIVYVTVVSLFISFTLTPMMCGAMLQVSRSDRGDRRRTALTALWEFLPDLWGRGFGAVRRGYLELLDWSLRRRAVTIVTTLAMMAVCAVLLVTVVGSEFFPASDEGKLRVSVETPIGSSLAFTSDRILDVEKVVAEHIPEKYLIHYYSRSGRASGMMGGTTTGANLGEVGVTLVDKADRDKRLQDILNDLRPHLARVHSSKLTAGAAAHGPGGTPISVEITGRDMKELQRVAGEVVAVVASTPGTSDVDQSYRVGQPEIRIVPDQEQCARHNLTVSYLAMTMRSYIEGQEVSQFRDRGEDYEIVLKLQEGSRKWAEDVGAMFLKSPATGAMISIGDVADVKYESGPTVIRRKDRRRLIAIESELSGDRPLGNVMADIRNGVDTRVTLPEDVRVGYGGQSEMMADNFRELFKAMATAGGLTFLCVAGIIESVLYGILILMAVPVCLIGVTLAMLIGNVMMNIFSLMAMIMLVGMVVNNAIILLDYAMREVRKNLPAAQRIREACAVRFRVILMANFTTVIAMIPLSLGLGFAGEIFKPLAVVQMGGVVAAATLTMVVIPAIYTAIESRRE